MLREDSLQQQTPNQENMAFSRIMVVSCMLEEVVQLISRPNGLVIAET